MPVFSRILRRIAGFRANLSMSCLYGSQLGWRPLINRPGLIRGRVFDSDDICLPWFTYPAIAQLLRMNLRGECVLEYGSGSSTQFFLDKGCRVRAIEHHQAWAEFVQQSMYAGDGSVRYISDAKDYVQSAEQLADFRPSIILVDGTQRLSCCESILEYVASRAASGKLWMIILDNSDWHGSSYSTLKSLPGFVPIDYYGHGPYNSYTWCTTLYMRLDSELLRSKMMAVEVARPMLNGLTDHWSADL